MKDVKDIDEQDQRAFFHEYLHFLQDITGGFGHSHIWQTYDRMAILISDLQQHRSTRLVIPLKRSSTDRHLLFEGLRKSMEGSYGVPKPLNDHTVKVKSANLYMNDSFKKLYPEKQLHFLNLKLEDDRGQRGDYHFGEAAVSETMAYLLEERLFGEKKADNFPYKACDFVAQYLDTNFVQNREFLFALCDLSMCCPYPGMSFYTMLLDFRNNKFHPTNAEEIYEEGEKTLSERGWDIWGEFEKSRNGAIHLIKQLFNHQIFTDTVKWFTYLLDTGYTYRRQNPYFMLELYREGNFLEGRYWTEMYTTFGMPQLHTQDFIRYVCAPLLLKDFEKGIEPLFLLSLKQVNDTLLYGKSKCELYECCKNAIIGPETDYRCVTEPWERAKDENTCAFGAQWFLYGLNQYEVNFE